MPVHSFSSRCGVVGLFSLAIFSLLATGCGPDEPFTHAKIHGTITYEDGTPIPAHRVRVIFEPQAEPIDSNTHPRPGEVELEPDGSFDNVSSHKYGDGVVVGKHKVIVIPYDDQDRETQDVPKQYQQASTTPLEIDTAEFSEENPIELKIPKK